MMSNTFVDWFEQDSVPSATKYLQDKGLEARGVLVIDNAPVHPKILQDWDPNFKVLFLPPNTSCAIQPMDQNINSTFKHYYGRYVAQFALEFMEKGIHGTQFWKQFNVKHAVDFVTRAWNDIKQSTLQKCWRKVWPDLLDHINGGDVEEQQAEPESVPVPEFISQDIVPLLEQVDEIMDFESLDSFQLEEVFGNKIEIESHEQQEQMEDNNLMNEPVQVNVVDSSQPLLSSETIVCDSTVGDDFCAIIQSLEHLENNVKIEISSIRNNVKTLYAKLRSKYDL